MQIPKTNGGNIFVGAGDTNGDTVTMNTTAKTMNLQLDAMTTAPLRCSSGGCKVKVTHPITRP